MKIFGRTFVFTLVALFLMLEITLLLSAQEKYLILIGTVKGVHRRMGLEVESEKDKSIVNFRIGRRTIYTPHRYPDLGEKVKVEYLIDRGVPIAYIVTFLGSSK